MVEYFNIQFPTSASILDEGKPNLPKYSSSIIIPDRKNMNIDIISRDFIDYENINIAPSKGNFSSLSM